MNYTVTKDDAVKQLTRHQLDDNEAVVLMPFRLGLINTITHKSGSYGYNAA